MLKIFCIQLLFYYLQHYANALNISNVFLVDKIGKNFLFTIPSPLEQNNKTFHGVEFQYDLMVKLFKEKIRNLNYTVPEKYIISDYSLIFQLSETTNYMVEQSFFDQLNSKGEKGRLNRWSILGVNIGNANTFYYITRKFFIYIYSYWSWDQLDIFLPKIRADLEKQEEKAKFIFFHSSTNFQRVLVLSSYQLMYFNTTFTQVIKDISQEFKQISLTIDVQDTLSWFCWILQYQHEYQSGLFKKERSKNLECEYQTLKVQQNSEL